MLSVLALVGVIVCTVNAFKTARGNGRNGFLWALLTFGIGFGLQFIMPFFIGAVLGFVWAVSGSNMDEIRSKIQGPALWIGIVGIVLSFIGMGLVLEFVSRVPDGMELPPSKEPSSLGLG